MASYLDYLRSVDRQYLPSPRQSQVSPLPTPSAAAGQRARIQAREQTGINQRGGGGCPDGSILVPDLPFDFLQPPMSSQVVQVGNGGPYVIRSNPIGAIFDAVRGFCFPVPMMATGDGSYEDLSGMGLGSPGADSSLPGPAEGTPFIGGFGAGPQAQPQSMITCGTGTIYDSNVMQCVPTSALSTAGTPSFCGLDALDMAAQKLTNAAASCDAPGIATVRYQAGACSKVAPPQLRPRWKALNGEAIRRQQTYAQQCRMGRRMAGTSPANAMGNPSQANIAGIRSRTITPASPLSLTESTPRFQATSNPMAGMFDPATVQGGSYLGSPRRYGRRQFSPAPVMRRQTTPPAPSGNLFTRLMNAANRLFNVPLTMKGRQQAPGRGTLYGD